MTASPGLSQRAPPDGDGAARLGRAMSRVYMALAWAGCAALATMLLVISLDVALRNLRGGGLEWSAEVAEYALYLMTLLAAPWLLHEGRHIRVDLLLRVLPSRVAWMCEWAVDILGALTSLVLAWYGAACAWDSLATGALTMKNLAFPEWWLIAPFPLLFLLLALEFVLRWVRLAHGPRQPRDEAVSAA